MSLKPEHVAEVCNYLAQEARLAASDHRALAARMSSGKRTMLKAADEWAARASWIREAEGHMTAQLEKA